MATAQISTPSAFGVSRTRLAFRKPRNPYLLAAAIMMASGSVVFREPAPYDIALVLLLVTGILLNRLSFEKNHRLALVLLAGFIAANFIPLPNAVAPHTALAYSAISFYLAASWLFFAGVTSTYGYAAAKALLKGYIAAGLLSATLATLAYLHAIPFQSTLLRYGRAQGLFKDPNVYGPYLVPVLLCGLVAVQSARILSLRFWGALVTCSISIVGIFVSFSRACWINTAVSVVFLLGFELLDSLRQGGIRKGVLRVPVTLAAVAAITVIFIAANSATGQMLFTRLGSNGLHDYDATRFNTQRKALDSFLNNPVGIGTRQSEFVFQYATHNMYLRVLTENGFLGFATFFTFIALSLLRCMKLALTLKNRHWRTLFVILSSALAGLLVNGFVIDTIRWRHFWFLLGLAWCTPAKKFSATRWLAERAAWRASMVRVRRTNLRLIGSRTEPETATEPAS